MGYLRTLTACLTLAGLAAAAATPARLSFNRDIRPILSENCFACHGPDNANRQAGLRLDTFELATAELDSGSRAIVPEKIDESELVARIVSDDPDSVMPPPHAKIGRLSPEQVETLKRWIAQGAQYEPHWAFVPPAKPESAAAGGGPAAIDAIVREKLAKRGLALQPEADRRTLIRRASFDITGLPPTSAEVEAFVADS
ncbi:MAG: c-type cytochrome domain-containing protein, partial [Planctomycetia bacterium]